MVDLQQFDLVGIYKVNPQQDILAEVFGHYEPVCESCITQLKGDIRNTKIVYFWLISGNQA